MDDDQERKLLELAKAGARPADIATAIGEDEVDVVDAARMILRAKHPGHSPDVAMELERLDLLNRAAWKGAVQGDQKSVKSVLDVQAARAELLAATPAQRLQSAIDVLLSKTVDNANEEN